MRCVVVMLMLVVVGESIGQVFQSGPVIGAVTPTSARVVFQVNEAVPVVLTVEEDFLGTVRRDTLHPPFLHGFGRFDLDGLSPYTVHELDLSVVGHPDVSVHGRFRTFPPEGHRGIYTVVAGSCQETENMKVFDVIPRHDPLLMVHTGDYTYPDYQIAPDYSADYATVARSYTRRYNEKKMKEMLRSVPIDYVFDDNDHVGGSSGRFCKNDFESEERGLLRVENFFRADSFPRSWLRNVIRGYADFFPHYPLEDTAEAIHHSFVLGNAEFFVLDRNSTRPFPYSYAFRRDRRGRWAFAPPDDHCLFCPAQMAWLKEGLRTSTADWKFIVSGVPLNRNLSKLIHAGLDVQSLRAKGYSGFHMAYGFASYWAGYPAELEDFHRFIEEEGITDVIAITGDTHHNAMDDGTNAGIPELNASGLSVTGTYLAKYLDLLGLLTGRFRIERDIWNQGGNCIGNDNDKNAFGKVVIHGNEFVELSIVDEDDHVISSFRVPHSSAR